LSGRDIIAPANTCKADGTTQRSVEEKGYGEVETRSELAAGDHGILAPACEVLHYTPHADVQHQSITIADVIAWDKMDEILGICAVDMDVEKSETIRYY
jgi:hypothetical protein